MRQPDEEFSPFQRLLSNSVACVCCLACVVTMSVAAGGWHIIFKAGTDPKLCTLENDHRDGADLFEEVCVNGGTEWPFSGVYDKHYVDEHTGVYRCACCGAPLFPSATKFNSRTGWPSFWAPVAGDDVIGYSNDQLQAVEVHCHRCRAHLGHVFDDGAGPTGHRYCINSVCLLFDANVTMPYADSVPWIPNVYLSFGITIAGICSCCLLGCRLVGCFKEHRPSCDRVLEVGRLKVKGIGGARAIAPVQATEECSEPCERE
eukprot:TRINITY_DN17091_c0_g2_i1.p1 TRINITY_DN17091_c0_g2~~TRINITY_DN17091_c0_g2_i1.p1  ORF type:complete len:260 (-),score=36.51 TRINITY_DN17091_c0_g2_i1:25-804(-)